MSKGGRKKGTKVYKFEFPDGSIGRAIAFSEEEAEVIKAEKIKAWEAGNAAAAQEA